MDVCSETESKTETPLRPILLTNVLSRVLRVEVPLKELGTNNLRRPNFQGQGFDPCEYSPLCHSIGDLKFDTQVDQ